MIVCHSAIFWHGVKHAARETFCKAVKSGNAMAGAVPCEKLAISGKGSASKYGNTLLAEVTTAKRVQSSAGGQPV